ncbi:MAG TPA: DNA-binding protein [Octadecabacter sp.]|nr:DNA-binding protein [Octadecabacter sp.]
MIASKATTKPVATTKAVATPAKTTVPQKATIVETVKPLVAGAPIKKPELIERVMAETGMKKKDVKPVVEAMLSVLGRALTKGEDLTVPPLGKLMVKRTKEAANATIVTVKLRHPNNPGGQAKTIAGDEVI